MLLEARELSDRLAVSELSRKLLGWDMRSSPFDEDLSLVDDNSILRSPTKSPSKNSRFRRPQTEDERQERYDEATVLLDLEFVVWAYVALDNFRETWEHLELCVCILLVVFGLLLTNFSFRMTRLKNSVEADDMQVEVLSARLQECIEHATEHVEGLIDKECGVLTQMPKCKL